MPVRSQIAFNPNPAEDPWREMCIRDSYDAGLNYAKQSLTLLPENPLLLVSVADVEAQKHLNDAAISDARDAVEYLDRFAAPGTVTPESWPLLKNKLKATAEFAQSRALLEQALALPKLSLIHI